jgi:hypothetical protein
MRWLHFRSLLFIDLLLLPVHSRAATTAAAATTITTTAAAITTIATTAAATTTTAIHLLFIPVPQHIFYS